MSPFAGYKDFADCVAKNKDKGNPKAYCATIMRKTEGEKMETQIEEQRKRPPKDWWDRCVSSVGRNPDVDDPSALCGWVWYHQKGSDPDDWSVNDVSKWWEQSTPKAEEPKERLSHLFERLRKKKVI